MIAIGYSNTEDLFVISYSNTEDAFMIDRRPFHDWLLQQ